MCAMLHVRHSLEGYARAIVQHIDTGKTCTPADIVEHYTQQFESSDALS
jgi:hypothetical protein